MEAITSRGEKYCVLSCVCELVFEEHMHIHFNLVDVSSSTLEQWHDLGKKMKEPLKIYTYRHNILQVNNMSYYLLANAPKVLG